MKKYFEVDKASGEMSEGRRAVMVELQELEDADVRYISLVQRGANRVPFRIMKSEDENMLGLDLGQIFKRQDEGETPNEPRIAAILINESVAADAIVAALKAEGGFEFDEVDTETIEGSRLIKFEDYDDDAAVVKLNDDVALVMVGVARKQLTPAPSGKFSENLSQMQFVPGMNMAAEALMQTMFNVMMEAEDKDTMKAEASTAVEEFSAFMLSLVDSIPQTAFKIEGIYAGSDIQSMVRRRQAQVQQDFGATQNAKSNEDNAGRLPGQGQAGTEVHTGRSQKAESEDQTPESKDKEVVKADSDLLGMDDARMDQLLASITANFKDSNTLLREELLKSLNETVGTVRKEFDSKLEELTGKVTKAGEDASKAELAVKGTIVSKSLDDDQLGLQTGREERKQNRLKRYAEQNVDAPGIFDNAFAFPGYED